MQMEPGRPFSGVCGPPASQWTVVASTESTTPTASAHKVELCCFIPDVRAADVNPRGENGNIRLLWNLLKPKRRISEDDFCQVQCFHRSVFVPG